jgi:hypothetical protein
MPVTTTLIGALLLAGWSIWALRHLLIFARRCPPLAYLCGPAAATAAVERRLAHRLVTRQIDEATYRSAMKALTAHRQGRPPSGPRRT